MADEDDDHDEDDDPLRRFKSAADFDTFQENLLRVVSRDPAKFGLTEEDVARLRASREDFSRSHQAHMAATRQARDARRELRAATANLAAALPRGREGEMGRPLPLRISMEPDTPLDPVTAPIARITNEEPLALDMDLYDEEEPGLGTLPEDVAGCEIWMALGDEPPESPIHYELLDTTKELQYSWLFEEEEAGQTAHFLVRWIGTNGEHGPWSEVLTAKVPAA
jgi:hypothetical protein